MPWMRSLIVCALLAGLARTEDWPQWLGPRRDGTTPAKIAPWKETPKPEWKVEVGEGHSSPIVADGKVFLHTRVSGDEETVACYELASGKQLWSKTYDRGKLHDKFVKLFGIGPRSTPLYEAGKLYTYGVTGLLKCWDAADGKLLWTVDTVKEFAAPPLLFGVSSSPILDGDRLILLVGGKGASVVALNKHNGKLIWKSMDDPPSYASPILFTHGKTRQVVFLTQQGLAALDPEKGTVYWKVSLVDRLNESSITPLKVGDLIIGSSVTFGSLAAKMSIKDGKPTAEEVWKNRSLNCYFSSPALIGKDHVYMVTGQLALNPTGTLHCVEASSGKILWSKPRVGTYHASLYPTGDGKILMLVDDGQLVLIDPNPKEYRELARSRVCGKTWAHPAIASGKLVLRDEKSLYCFALEK